jgi:hypothetical protein
MSVTAGDGPPVGGPLRLVPLGSAPGHWISVGLLVIGLALTVVTYFRYRGPGWPLGTQGVEGVVAILVIAVTLGFGLWVGRRSGYRADRSLLVGLSIGLLWTVEICINNFLHPGLPWRDIIDDAFWALVTAVIVGYAAVRAYHAHTILAGLAAGLWSGFASGLVACVTGLLITVFGIQLVVNDPLTVMEWQRQGSGSGLTDPVVFSAYETLFGAIGHLHLIGTLMGILFGLIGGIAGWAAWRQLSKRNA